jgi:hypothetical protein
MKSFRNLHVFLYHSSGGKSQEFSVHYGRVAQEMWCAFMDASTIIVTSPLDGIHLEASEHHKLGQALALKVRELLE